MTTQELITEATLILIETNSLNCDCKKYKATRMENLYLKGAKGTKGLFLQ